jgi:hypothetical protein
MAIFFACRGEVGLKDAFMLGKVCKIVSLIAIRPAVAICNGESLFGDD